MISYEDFFFPPSASLKGLGIPGLEFASQEGSGQCIGEESGKISGD